MSMFVTRPSSGGGGGTPTPPTQVIDNLTTQSAVAALSANMGFVLNGKIVVLANDISDLQLAMTALEMSVADFDDDLDALSTAFTTHESTNVFDGSVHGLRVGVNGLEYLDTTTGTWTTVGSGEQSGGSKWQDQLLTTTIIDQKIWDIPFADYEYPNDLLLVNYNTTWLTTEQYTVQAKSDGTGYELYIPHAVGEISENSAYLVMFKNSNTNPNGVIQQTYSFFAPTTSVGQNTWDIDLSTFDPNTDNLVVNHNNQILTPDQYTITGNSGAYKITLSNIDSQLPIDENKLFLTVFKNTVGTGTNLVSGLILADDTVPETKLTQSTRDKLAYRTITFETQGIIPNGEQNAQRPLPFSCTIKNFDITLITPAEVDMFVNIKKTTDFVTWTDVLSDDINIPANEYFVNHTPASTIQLNEGEIVRLFINNTSANARSIAVNLNAYIL